MTLAWVERDGGDFLDLSATGPPGAGLYLAVRPHAAAGYFRPLCLLVPGEEEREIGDGVLGREHARDTVVKYAIQALARLHGVPATQLRAEDGEPWPERTIAALWALLEAAPHSS
ncbi:MAG TPA: hypothetical protein VIW03_04285 [Anaeromyxobacter sp.]